VSSAQLDIARQIGLDRQAEARASALTAAFRLARQERRLRARLFRVAAQVNADQFAA